MDIPLIALAHIAIHWGWPFGCFLNAGICSCGGILLLMLSFFVWVDAERRGQPGCLWAIVVFFFNIVGVLVYLIVAALTDKRK